MPEYNDQINHINQILLETMRPIYQSQKLIYDSMSSSRAIQESINKMMRPYREFSEKLLEEFSKPFSSLADGISKRIAEEMAESFKSFDSLQMDKEFAESIQRMIRLCSAPELINVPKGHAYDFPEDLGGLSDDDFVVVNKSAIKVYDFPDTVAIPFGSKKVRFKTEFFVSLLVNIIIGFVSIAVSLCQGCAASQSESDYQSEQLCISYEILSADQKMDQLQQIEIQTLNNLLQSVDSSNSTQSELIQSLKEFVQAQSLQNAELQESDQTQNMKIQELTESLDSNQCSSDKKNTSDGTESEK